MTLKGKFILTIVLSIVVPVSVLSGFGYFSIRGSIIDSEGQRLQEISSAALREVDRTISARSSELGLLVGMGGITTSFEYELFDPATSLLQEFANNFNWYKSLHIINPKGELLASTRGEGSASPPEAYQDIAAGKIVLGKPHLDEKDGSVYLAISVPVYVGGKQVGLLVAEYAMEHLNAIIDDIFVTGKGQSEEGHIMLVDPSGVVTYAPKFERESRQNVLKENLGQGTMESVQLVLAGENGFRLETDEHGMKALVAFVPPTGGMTGFSALTLHNISNVLQSVFGLVKGMIVLVVLLIMAGLVLAFVVGAQTANPILRVIGGLFEAAGRVKGTSELMSTTSDTLSSGSADQASSLEEVAASVNETASTVSQNAERAAEARSLMEQSRTVVQEATQAMTELTGTMKRISEVSAKTAKIVKTIDEIAFQTNLLALNAAVEAARAGEAGAGFAVVADEVRNLALRATTAAKETGDLIDGSLVEVGNGASFVEKADASFQKVAESSEKISVIVNDIAVVSAQQASAITEISRGVEGVNAVAQQNVAIAAESAAGAQDLRAQSENLNGYVQQLERVVGGGRQMTGQTAVGGYDRRKNPAMASEKAPSQKMALPAPRRSAGITSEKDLEF